MALLNRNGFKSKEAPVKLYQSPLDVFKKQSREEYKKLYNSISEANKALKAKWESFSEQEKEKYVKIYEETLQQYEQSLILFNGGTLEDANNVWGLRSIPPRPSQPLNAMFRFFKDHREQVNKDNSNLKLGDTSKILTGLWNKLDEKKKKPYYDEYKIDSEKYHDELDKWNTQYKEKYLNGQRLIKQYIDKPPKKEKKQGISLEERRNSKPKRSLVSLSPPKQPQNQQKRGRSNQKKEQIQEQEKQDKSLSQKKEVQKRKPRQQKEKVQEAEAEEQFVKKEKSVSQKREGQKAKKGNEKDQQKVKEVKGKGKEKQN